MKFTATPLGGVMVVDVEAVPDERGLFARSWCSTEFRRHGLDTALSQISVSFNLREGTLRGLHWQDAPHSESKIVRCTRGAVFDVALDLRRGSPTFCRWYAVELSQDNRRALYIPHGVAHGFQTLCDETELLYQISVPYHAASARGVRWNDPAFSIVWPLVASRVVSDRDDHYPDFVP